MVPKQYKLSYIPIFYDDLYEAVSYIILKLKMYWQRKNCLSRLRNLSIKDYLLLSLLKSFNL